MRSSTSSAKLAPADSCLCITEVPFVQLCQACQVDTVQRPGSDQSALSLIASLAVSPLAALQHSSLLCPDIEWSIGQTGQFNVRVDGVKMDMELILHALMVSIASSFHSLL